MVLVTIDTAVLVIVPASKRSFFTASLTRRSSSLLPRTPEYSGLVTCMITAVTIKKITGYPIQGP